MSALEGILSGGDKGSRGCICRVGVDFGRIGGLILRLMLLMRKS